MKKVVNFGCRLNSYESEAIEKIVTSSGGTKIVFNTCSVTKNAELESINAVKTFASKNTNAKIYVTGCASQLNSQAFSSIKGVHKIIDNKNKLDPFEYDMKNYLPSSEKHIQQKGKTRSFVAIQNGCNHSCTFCNIHIARGKNISKKHQDIIDEIKSLIKKNYVDITLTGVDITDYGSDIGSSLPFLIHQILRKVEKLERLRLSSMDVSEINNDFMSILAENTKLMPYLHISLQSGDNMILKRMKRRHSVEQAYNFCKIAREIKNNVVFGADIIAGFPTETEEMFENTLKLVKDLNITYLHVFPFSPRPGTPAAKMPQTDRQTIHYRAMKLRKAGEENARKYHTSLVGQEKFVLLEKNNTGRTEEFTKVKIANSSSRHIGKIIKAKITGAESQFVTGEIL